VGIITILSDSIMIISYYGVKGMNYYLIIIFPVSNNGTRSLYYIGITFNMEK